MKLVTYHAQGQSAPGRIEGDEVVDLSQDGRFADLGELIATMPAARLARLDGRRRPLSSVRLLAPIPRPPKFVAVGLNYRDHALEQNKQPPEYPMFFAKARNCVIGPDERIELPNGRQEIDVEVELGVVFGLPGGSISRERALEHVLGFTIVNDVSDRKAQRDDKQFYRAKSFRTFGPMGPVVVTPDEFDHRDAPIRLWRSGNLQQESSTKELLFSVERLIELLSAAQDIEPGDVLATGTPAGVGVFRTPPVFLQDGDTIVCEIEGLGKLTNPVVRS